MKKVGDMMSESIGREEILRTARAQRIVRNWAEIVGPLLAEKSSPSRFDRGTLWVSVQSSEWAQELRMMKRTILAKLAQASGDPELFKDVRFGTRPIPEEEPTPEDEARKRAEYRESIADLSIAEIRERRLTNWPGEKRD